MDSNHRSEDATDLQSAPIGHSGTLPYSIGAGGRIRTPDLLITNQLLYQLSYTSISTARSAFTDPALQMTARKRGESRALYYNNNLHADCQYLLQNSPAEILANSPANLAGNDSRIQPRPSLSIGPAAVCTPQRVLPFPPAFSHIRLGRPADRIPDFRCPDWRSA